MFKIYFVILFIISLINGCASVDYTRSGSEIPVYEGPAYVGPDSDQPVAVGPVEDASQAKVITTAAVDSQFSNTQVAKVQKSSVPASREAVLDLLSQSKSAMEQNEYDEAENLLKRALRIEPGNAWLWHNMAVLKFYQEDYHQAIQQALKSNNLAKNNQQLRANNGKIIKQSYIELGEEEKSR